MLAGRARGAHRAVQHARPSSSTGRTPGPPRGRGAGDRADALGAAAVLQRLPAARSGWTPKRDFADLTSDVAVQRRLAELYGDIDHLEWYVGIFAEDYPDDQMMGELLTAMVG